MKGLQPAVFVWTGDIMVPVPAALPLCMRQYVKDEQYRMSVEAERSVAAHRRFFAIVNEAWQNLPEHLTDCFPTPDRLRYWCLVKCYFAHEQTVVYQTAHDAELFAEYIRKKEDDSVIQCERNVVKIWTPHSMKYASMNKEEFHKAADAVCDLLSDMLGVSVAELTKNAGKAA